MSTTRLIIIIPTDHDERARGVHITSTTTTTTGDFYHSCDNSVVCVGDDPNHPAFLTLRLTGHRKGESGVGDVGWMERSIQWWKRLPPKMRWWIRLSPIHFYTHCSQDFQVLVLFYYLILFNWFSFIYLFIFIQSFYWVFGFFKQIR